MCMNYQVQQMLTVMTDALARCMEIANTTEVAARREQPEEAPPLTVDEGTHTERVVRWMRSRPGMRATRAELKQALSLGDNSLSGALSRLKDRGVLELLGRGRYRLRLGRS
jgi:hypothetical protein